jgi:8-oxo-dGTP pyrophosphatase MutT (NUDIX family)
MAEIRADMVTVFVFRRTAGRVEFLQLRRAREPHAGTWQPIMGGITPNESTSDAAIRELREEAGLDARPGACLGLWALERVRPFYMRAADAVVLSPSFAAEAAPGWTPVLNGENDSFRWVPAAGVAEAFVWPGHAASCRDVMDSLLRPGSACEALLRVPRS